MVALVEAAPRLDDRELVEVVVVPWDGREVAGGEDAHDRVGGDERRGAPLQVVGRGARADRRERARGTAAGPSASPSAGCLLEVEDLGDPGVEAGCGIGERVDEGRHLGLPAGVGLALGHGGCEGREVLDLKVGEQVVSLA